MDKEVTNRLVRVFDIIVPIVVVGAFALYIIEEIDSYRTDFADYALYVFVPNIWWVIRYVLIGQFLPNISHRIRKPRSEPSGEGIKPPLPAVGVDDPVTEPSTELYIGVWLLAAFLSRSATSVLDAVAASELQGISYPSGVYFVLVPTFAMLLNLGIWIGIYKWVKSLRISRVMPYIYLSTVLSCLFEVAVIGTLVTGFYRDGDMYAFMIYTLVLHIGFAMGFRAAFRNTDRWE